MSTGGRVAIAGARRCRRLTAPRGTYTRRPTRSPNLPSAHCSTPCALWTRGGRPSGQPSATTRQPARIPRAAHRTRVSATHLPQAASLARYRTAESTSTVACRLPLVPSRRFTREPSAFHGACRRVLNPADRERGLLRGDFWLLSVATQFVFRFQRTSPRMISRRASAAAQDRGSHATPVQAGIRHANGG